MHHKTLGFFHEETFQYNLYITSIKHMLYSSYLNPCTDKTVIVLKDYKGNRDLRKDMMFQLISITLT